MYQVCCPPAAVNCHTQKNSYAREPSAASPTRDSPFFLSDTSRCLPKKHRYAAWPRRAFVRGGRREGTVPRPPGTRRATTQPDAVSDLFRITSPHLEVFWTLSIFSLGLSIDERNMFRADSLGRFLPPNAETQCFLAGSPPGRALLPATKGPLVRQQQRSIFNTNYFRPQNNGSFCARSSAFPRQTMYHSRKDRR